MDRRSPLRLRLSLMLLVLLVSTSFVCLHGNPVTGVDHKLHCVNDYLFTINCTLSIAPSQNISDSNSSYWLNFTDTYKEPETFTCVLTNTNGDGFCSVKRSDAMSDDDYYAETFKDTETFQISLCHSHDDGSDSCKLLDGEYESMANIKPNPPCCLTVTHNSGQHHFTWKSTYEEYSDITSLVDDLKYQLHYYKRGEEYDARFSDKQVISYEINTDSLNFSVDDHNFVPDTEYSARVRSSPNQVYYMGQWSDWSSEVYWKMGPDVQHVSSNRLDSGLDKVFISLCVTVPVVLLLCYAPVKKWRQSSFIPTPAPYFHSLYSDCQGDFKSWVVTQEKTADMLKAEETLQIDTLTKCADIQEEECQPHLQFIEGSTYSNITDPGCDASLLGVPYAVSTMTPPSAPGSSLKSLTLSSKPGSPAEGDSGCYWLGSDTSLEKEHPFYCNEYCTLSAFQQTNLVTAKHHGSPSTKSCSTQMSRADTITEA